MSTQYGPETTAALAALKMGQNLVDPSEGGSEDTSSDVESSELSLEDGGEGEVETAEVSEQESAEVQEGSADADKAIDEIWIDDGKGRKKVTIDYSDKAAIKKYAEMAYGMRKFQRERDQLTEWKKEKEPVLNELQQAWTALESAYEVHGVKGLVDLLVGEPDAYSKHIQQILDETNLRQNGSEEEVARFEAKQEAERIRKENAKMQKELQRQLDEQKSSQETAQLKQLQDKMTQAYSKWSFEGKLGDVELEEQYNTALWELSRSKLKEIPDSEELSPGRINAVFQEVASRFNKAVVSQTKKKVAATVQKKKDAAATKAAAVATSGVRQSAVVDEFKGHIRSGNITESLKMFMSGKVKIK